MNIKKDKIKNRLLTLSLLFIIVSCNENPIDDDFNFKNGKLIKYLGTDEVVVIPSSYEENGERIGDNCCDVGSRAREQSEKVI